MALCSWLLDHGRKITKARVASRTPSSGGCDSKPKRRVPTRILGRSIRPHSNLCVVIGMDRHALQTQFPPSGIELRNGPQFPLPSSHSVSTMAAATNPIATPIKGLSTANQKETFQPLVLGFLSMLIPQAAQHQYFTKREISFATATAAGRYGQRWR